MIVKFLANKSGGGIGSVDYLLDQKRLENGTARIIKGDEQNTRDLIMSISKKQKTTFGVLSFEEANIPEAQKYELMAEFEKTFCAGLRKDQYNILWVEHTDKGRLELNCIIPKIELSTGKSFNPYFNGSDFHLADLFQNSCNFKYGFSDPKDPAKTATVSGSKKQIGLFKDYEELDQKLKLLVSEGSIQDRSELVALLVENGIEVTRQGGNYISVKLPESKKARRLNGGIYEKQFTSVDELGDIREEVIKRERAFTSRDRDSSYRATYQRLSNAVTKRALYNAEQYREPKKRERELEIRVAERERELKIVSERDNRSSQQRPNEAQKVRIKKPMGHNQGEIDNDRIRNTIQEYARAREERSRARTRRSSERAHRISLYTSINQQTESTDYRAIAETHRERQLRDNLAEGIKQLPRILDRVVVKITERVKELIKPIDKELEVIRRMFGKTDTQRQGLKEAVDGLFNREKEQQPTRSSGLFR